MEYNVCKTCGACDGRCGIMIDSECLNCHHTREKGEFCLHADLDRTDEEMEKKGQILDHCERCGRFLDPTNRVCLELKLGTDEYYEPGILDPEDSQGCFVFGRDCARKVKK